ncbi:MAG: hypothetical protein CBD18_04275 [Opitutales bacterium TMED158]|nr:MAG: hypothetical protein CBD18_04275 [Opitutales bacterium TMED158]
MDSDKSGIPIVALTANALEEHRKKSIDAGMDDHLTKPLKLEALGAVVEKCLEAVSNR